MKKHRKAKKFLDELKLVPIVSSVCEKLDISRNSIYNWRKDDPEFCRAMDEALEVGSESVSDLAESKLIQHIKNGAPWAIRFHLENNKKNYIKPRIQIVNRPYSNEIVFRNFSEKKKDTTDIVGS